MKKRMVSWLLLLAMVIGLLPMAVSSTEPERELVYISISDDAQYILDAQGNSMAFAAVPLEELTTVDLDAYGLQDYVYDADGDGVNELTALHLYIYVHEQLMGLDFSQVGISGSAGSLYFYTGLFGYSDENLRYDYNGAYPAVDGWGLTADRIILSDGDFLNVAHYTSWAFWGDSLTGFHYFTDSNGIITHNLTVKAGQPCQVNLVRSYSDWMNGGTALAGEPYVEVYYGTAYGDSTGSCVTDEEGAVEINFPSEGIWYVWSDGGYGMENPDDIVSAPAFTVVNVEPDADRLAADAVTEKIAAIGEVTIFTGARVTDARVAYDALTENQKALVSNAQVLFAAEETRSQLYAQAANPDCGKIFRQTGSYLANLGTPGVGSVGGEWMVIDLTRAGEPCPEGYYENVVEYVSTKINDKQQLHRAKSTDNSRVILGLTAAGYDVTDVAGHNLLVGLTDMTYVKKQGINGPIWALIAFDCHDYAIPQNSDAKEQVTREGLIAYILEKQLDDGGWALSGKVADPDMTGMAIQSLAPYYATDPQVKVAVDAALTCLSAKQHENGGFGSIDGVCTESCAQVIVALTALGIDPETDPRFVKNGVSVLDAMCLFAVEGGGFAHTPNGGLNGMATEQSQYALAAYFRYKNGQTSLYDMTDVTIAGQELVGDVNRDGKVGMKDWSMLYDHINEISLLSDEALQFADINGDGKVNMKDWSQLYEIVTQ